MQRRLQDAGASSQRIVPLGVRHRLSSCSLQPAVFAPSADAAHPGSHWTKTRRTASAILSQTPRMRPCCLRHSSRIASPDWPKACSGQSAASLLSLQPLDIPCSAGASDAKPMLCAWPSCLSSLLRLIPGNQCRCRPAGSHRACGAPSLQPSHSAWTGSIAHSIR